MIAVTKLQIHPNDKKALQLMLNTLLAQPPSQETDLVNSIDREVDRLLHEAFEIGLANE